jgi:Ferredoxin-dependent bilin reductase
MENIISMRAILLDSGSQYSWVNKVYKNEYVRRAHLDIIDAIETKKLYMMHICVFPNINDTTPLYGFDIIAGTNKVTGAFLDYSPIGDTDHKLCNYFAELVAPTEWSKPRELPEWARNIFSKQMIAAGNINTDIELDVILDLSKQSLIHYLDNIKTHGPAISNIEHNFTTQQNYYCQQQKQNPHTPRVLKGLGFTEEMAHDFIHKELFPEI